MCLQFLQHLVNFLISQMQQLHHFFDCKNDLSDSLYETIFSKFLYESGISKMLEKYPLYDFFQYSG